MKPFFTALVMTTAIFPVNAYEACLNCKEQQHWSSPLVHPAKFMQELDQLPMFIEQKNYRAIIQLDIRLSNWTAGRRYVYPPNYKEALEKITGIFNQFLQDRNQSAIRRMSGLMIKYRTLGSLYSPLRILADKDKDYIDKSNALWVLYINNDEDAEACELSLTPPHIFKSALPFIPSDLHVYLLKQGQKLKISDGLPPLQRIQIEQNLKDNVTLLESFNPDQIDKEFVTFCNERELAISEGKIEERKSEPIEST